MLSLAIRLTSGALFDTRERFDDIGTARRRAERLADRIRDTESVWLFTGEPTNPYGRVMETFQGSRI